MCHSRQWTGMGIRRFSGERPPFCRLRRHFPPLSGKINPLHKGGLLSFYVTFYFFFFLNKSSGTGS